MSNMKKETKVLKVWVKAKCTVLVNSKGEVEEIEEIDDISEIIDFEE